MTRTARPPIFPTPRSRISGEREPMLPMFWPLRMFRTLAPHRTIMWHFSRRSAGAGHRGSVLGRLWLVLDPLLMLAVYGTVFGFLFRARWDAAGGPATFALYMYAGILTYSLFSQSANQATGLIRSSAGYVKQMVFPLEVIPVSAVGGLLMPLAFGAGLLVVVNAFLGTGFSWTALLMPLALVPVVLLALGASWGLSALGVFVPDLGKATHVITHILFFMTPVVWPVERLTERLPEAWRWVVYANPLAVGVESVRSLVLRHEIPPLIPWVAATLVCAVACQLGFAVFMRSRRAFVDVL